MQSDAFPFGGLRGNSDAVVPDAQEAFAIPKTQADVDPSAPSVGKSVIHGFLGDAIKVCLDLGAKAEKRTITLESAGDRVQGLHIRGEGLERRRNTDLLQAHRVETPGQVACLTDGLVQQSGDLGSLDRRGLGTRRQLSGKRGTEGGDAGQILAQPVMQFAPQALFFPITDIEDLPFQPLPVGDVTGCRVDQSAVRQGTRVPLEPPVGAILAKITILEGNRLSAAGEHRNFRQRTLVVVRVHEIDKRPGLQFLQGPSQRALPGRVQLLEVPIKTGNAQQVERLGEETEQLILGLLDPSGQRFQARQTLAQDGQCLLKLRVSVACLFHLEPNGYFAH